MGRGSGWTVAVVAVTVSFAFGKAQVGTAHDLATQLPSERELHAAEVRVLGAEHAAEHVRQRRAQLRALERWRALSPVERRARRRHRRAAAIAFAEASAAEAGPPNVVGRWTRGPFRLYGSDFAIHAALLPTGKVLFWGRPARGAKFAPGNAAYDPATDPGTGERNANAGQASLWDPTKGYGADAFTPVTPPDADIDRDGDIDGPAPLFCSGQSHLPSGEVLVVGGNLVVPDLSPQYEEPAGTRLAFTFNPWTERWTAQPDMSVGRWYPTQLLLPSGNTLLVGGHGDSPPGGERTRRVELFVPGGRLGGVGRVKRTRRARRQTKLYPHLFTLPSGKVLLAGPGSTDSALLDPRRWRWSELPRPSGHRIAGTAVLMGDGRGKGSSEVMQVGGFRPLPSSPDDAPALKSTESIDLESKRGRWRRRSSLKVGRSDHNTVLLPDGSMVTIGGGNGVTPEHYRYTTDAGHARRLVELYDPATHTWRLGPAQQEDRTYHSVALLLPDGRVWSAGDDNFPIEAGGYPSQHDTGEIYSPPYLFDEGGNLASRPTIVAAPDSVEWGREFTVHTSGTAKKAVLVAPSAVTHGTDMQQRLVGLRVRDRNSGSLDIVAPASRAVAPPGYYMLFVISKGGTPSIASWVRLGGN
jgi:Galactose oxidase-like, Early set domain